MQESKQNNSRKLLLGMLLGLLLVVLGMFAVLLTMLPEEEKMGRLNPEDAFYVRRVISAQPTYKDKDNAYIEAMELLRNGRFMEAADVFEYLGDYADSPQKLSYCRYRLSCQKQKIENPWIVPQNHLDDFIGGDIYSAAHHGLIFVPKECNADTRCLIYFAGGTG